LATQECQLGASLLGPFSLTSRRSCSNTNRQPSVPARTPAASAAETSIE
jgi:hypothetical protein